MEPLEIGMFLVIRSNGDNTCYNSFIQSITAKAVEFICKVKLSTFLSKESSHTGYHSATTVLMDRVNKEHISVAHALKITFLMDWNAKNVPLKHILNTVPRDKMHAELNDLVSLQTSV
jgi:hypothetical protein